ncbi:MAG: hypothetical protein MI861_04380, partial [Pirellulales bacterium]|nr:hypothetical protein [Pirellulales bacterium]
GNVNATTSVAYAAAGLTSVPQTVTESQTSSAASGSSAVSAAESIDVIAGPIDHASAPNRLESSQLVELLEPASTVTREGSPLRSTPVARSQAVTNRVDLVFEDYAEPGQSVTDSVDSFIELLV